MAGTSNNPNIETGETSDPNKHTLDSFFILSQAKVITLKNAVAALGDTVFNPTDKAMIQVGRAGFEITVRVIDSITENKVYCLLSFNAGGLQDFECNVPLRKTVSLTSLYNVLEDASRSEEDNPVVVFVRHESNALSVLWASGPGKPVTVELQEVEPGYGKFPDVSYGFEAVITSQTLATTITEILEMDPESRPTGGLVTMKGTTVIMELNDDIVLTTENEPAQHEVWMDWYYWESFGKASCLANKCSMYLVTDPPEHIMFRFKLQGLGDLVYLTQAQFRAVSQLPELNRFLSLLK